jgi:hypothetical protein
VVFVDIHDFDFVIVQVERNRVVRPVAFIVINGALVVTVNQLARSSQRVDLARVDRFADLFDQNLHVVTMSFVGHSLRVAELGNLLPDFSFAWGIQARRGGGIGRDWVKDRDPIIFFASKIAFDTLLLAWQDRPGKAPASWVKWRNVAIDV